MSQLTAGRYSGFIVQKDIGEKNGMVQLYVKAEIHSDGNGNPIEPAETISGYRFLTKKDGSRNVKECENLQAALGWQGGLAELRELDASGINVNFTLENEVYNGNERLKIARINAPREPRECDPDTFSKLEAMFLKSGAGGGKPTSAPTPNVKKTSPAQRTQTLVDELDIDESKIRFKNSGSAAGLPLEA